MGSACAWSLDDDRAVYLLLVLVLLDGLHELVHIDGERKGRRGTEDRVALWDAVADSVGLSSGAGTY